MPPLLPLWMDAPCSPHQKAAHPPDMSATEGANGSKVHIAVDTLVHLLALKVTPTNEQERAQVGELAE